MASAPADAAEKSTTPTSPRVKKRGSWLHLLTDLLGAVLFVAFVVFVVAKIKSSGEEEDTSAGCLTVRTEAGVVEGTLIKFRLRDQTYTVVAFYGIPFAAPPTGEHRFAEPRCAEPWSGVFNATYKRPPCPQLDSVMPKNYSISGANTTEDCLHINIWVPGSCVSRARSHAVVFWLYGGSFVSGGNSYDFYDGRFMSGLGEVVVAMPNYRVNIFGYLNTGTEDVPGNMALHDQLFAARWVRANVHHFGGDGERILAAGQSAGSIAITMLMISPFVSQYNLFRRAYLMSASAKMPLPRNRGHFAREGFAHIAENAGCRADSVAKSLRCLREVDMLTVLQAAKTSTIWFVPNDKGPLLPGSTKDLINRFLPSRARDVIFTATKTEGTAFFEMLLPGYLGTRKVITSKTLKEMFPHLFGFASEALIDQMIDYLGTLYDLKDPNYKGWIDIIGDVLFRCPASNFGKYLAQMGKNVHFMQYAPKPSFSIFSADTATHGDDVTVFFGFPFFYPDIGTDEDKDNAYRMMIAVTNYAKNGSLPRLEDGSPWPPFSEATKYTIVEQSQSGYKVIGPGRRCTISDLIDRYISDEDVVVKREDGTVVKAEIIRMLAEMLASIPAMAYLVSGGYINITHPQ